MKKYLVIGDIGAHDGFVQEVEMDDIWSCENPDGWNYQDYCGAHGSVLDKCETYDEAERVLNDFLDEVYQGRF